MNARLAVSMLAALMALAPAARSQVAHAPLLVNRSIPAINSRTRSEALTNLFDETRQPRASHAKKGAVVGAVVGIATGLVAGSQMGTGCAVQSSAGCSPANKRRNNMAATAAIGGLIGAGVGALIGKR